jgi:hypothetical protein
MTGLGSRLLFTMAGSELWKSDGTPGGTGLLRSFDTVWIDTLVGGASRAYFRVYLGGTLFGDYELWTTDGTAEGTVPLGTFPREPVNPQAVVVDDVLLFAAYERSLPFSGPRRLWRSDGTVEGTRPILDVTPAEFARVGNRLYFSGDDGVHGAEPWVGWVNVLLERPAAAVADLRAETAALGLPRGTTNDLLAKLDTATRALARGEFRGVRDALEKFVRQLTRVPRHETDAGAIDEAIRFARDILELPAIAG